MGLEGRGRGRRIGVGGREAGKGGGGGGGRRRGGGIFGGMTGGRKMGGIKWRRKEGRGRRQGGWEMILCGALNHEKGQDET